MAGSRGLGAQPKHKPKPKPKPNPDSDRNPNPNPNLNPSPDPNPNQVWGMLMASFALITGGLDGMVKLWDPRTRALQRQLYRHNQSVCSLLGLSLTLTLTLTLNLTLTLP